MRERLFREAHGPERGVDEWGRASVSSGRPTARKEASMSGDREYAKL